MPEIVSVESNVDLVKYADREIYLVGTAHVSKQSSELVQDCIGKYQPDTVCLELCEPRYNSLSNPARWKETNIFEVIKSGRWYVLLAQLALAGFQRKLADKFGIKPGAEMLAAISTAKELGIPIYLIDREVRITLKRAWSKASIFSILRIMFSVILSLFSNEDIEEKDIEALKESDALTAMMAEFAAFLPGVKDALIDERDLFMIKRLHEAPGKRLVAIIGAGHVPGIKRHWNANILLDELNEIPPPRLSVKLISWGIPVAVVGLIVYGFFSSGVDTTKDMIVAWFLANGVLSALGTICALAHPLTVLTAFIAAPFTSLNPAIAAGWVAGAVEAYLRKPRVKDLETIGEDVTSFKGFWGNRVTRVLLVIGFANLGSVLGTAIGVGFVARLLAS